MQPISEDLLIAVIGVVGVVCGAMASPIITKRDRLAHAYSELAETVDRLQSQINAQEEDIEDLRKKLESSQRSVRKYEYMDDEKTKYIRRLGHWFEKTCSVLDKEWLERNPKPSLPDSLRGSIGKEEMK